MKFQHLPIGVRFEYGGAIYTKTGPISAVAEQGGQRMIPRHAELRPLDGPLTEVELRPGRLVDETRVRESFEAFCKECMGMFDEDAKAGFEAARLRFLESLGTA